MTSRIRGMGLKTTIRYRGFAQWFLPMVILVGSTPVFAQSALVDIRSDLNRLSVQFRSLSDKFRDPEVLDGRSFQERFTDAEVLFLLQDYELASLILLELVERPGAQAERFYDQAIYYAAESMYQISNDLSARNYFQDLLQRGVKAFENDAVRRLILISDRRRDWARVESQLAALLERRALSSEVAYVYAKSLLRQKRFDEVLSVVENIQDTAGDYARAQYLAAVAELEQNKLDISLARFSKIVELGDDFIEIDRVRDLSAMNVGRIYLEQDLLNESINAYQNISRASPFFDEALYEVTWTFVRAAVKAEEEAERVSQFEKAIQALEILLLTGNDSAVAPEARVLFGDILLRMKRYNRATTAFDEVVALYKPVGEGLAKLKDERAEPQAYYLQLSDETGKTPGPLPKRAVLFAKDDEGFGRAMGVVGDLDVSDSWVSESEDLITQLLKVLESDDRAKFFPKLTEAFSAYQTHKNQLVAIDERLVVVERSALEGSLSPKERERLQEILSERAKLEPEFRALPQTADDFEGRVEGSDARLQSLQKLAYQLRYPVQQMENELNAMRAWFASDQNKLSVKDRKVFQERLARQASEVEVLKKTQRDLETEIVTEKRLLAGSLAGQGSDGALRAKYFKNLEAERMLLAEASSGAGQGAMAILESVKVERSKVLSYNAELENFHSRLKKVVDFHADRLLGTVISERTAVQGYRDEITDARAEATGVVGDIAVSSLSLVADKFQNIVLRGDVGIVDVAWQLKEEQTKEISRKVNDQAREIQLLEQEFSEVLNE